MEVAAALFVVRDDEQRFTVIALVDAGRFWEWSPTTRQFHSAPHLADSYFGPDSSRIFKAMDPTQARMLAEIGLGRVSHTWVERYRSEARQGRCREVAGVFDREVGPPLSPKRRAEGVAEEAKRANGGWVIYQKYPAVHRNRAYVAASQIKSAKVRSFRPAGTFDAQASSMRGGDYVVHVRWLGKASSLRLPHLSSDVADRSSEP